MGQLSILRKSGEKILQPCFKNLKWAATQVQRMVPNRKDRHLDVLNRVELNAVKMESYSMDALNQIVRVRQEP